MAGIAQMESGLQSDVLADRPETMDYSVGLWQINYYGNLRDVRTVNYGTPAELQSDPLKQARAAVDLFGPNGAGLQSAWGGGNNPINGDIMFKVWQAKGAPQKPSEDTVLGWLRSINVTPNAQAGDYSIPEAGSGGAVSGVTGIAESKTGCAAKGGGFSFLGSGKIGTACQLKALTGGLLVGVGVSVMVTGAILLAMNTKAGKTAADVATGLIPGGGAVKALRNRGGKNRFPKVTAETRQESRAAFDARNPSPARQEAERKARSGNLGARSFSMDDLADMF